LRQAKHVTFLGDHVMTLTMIVSNEQLQSQQYPTTDLKRPLDLFHLGVIPSPNNQILQCPRRSQELVFTSASCLPPNPSTQLFARRLSDALFSLLLRDDWHTPTMANGATAPLPTPQFPTHNSPRTWLITSGDSPVGISLAKQALHHGDYVVSGIIQSEFESDQGRAQDYKYFLAQVGSSPGWKDRLKIVALDIR
jgi:hypothetical protein